MTPARASLTVWFACVSAAAAAAISGDPLHSPECVHARAELDAALAVADARHGGRLQRARNAARQACLGTDAGSRQRAGAPDPPQAMPPPAPAPAPVPRPPATAAAAALPAAAPMPPLSIARPTAITTCDPAGCWDSDGRRLNQMGPQLVGPRGVCIVQAGLVTCP